MKRILDLIIVLVFAPMWVPVALLTAILVRVFLGSPTVFTQVRPGRNQQLFSMYKFRSMTDAIDASGSLLPDEKRLSRFGRFLRASSMDELPELWNVLRGEMSLVGPRPLLVEYLPLYNDRQKRRHEMLPGITGWAQINGRNAISWEDKFEYDVWYVDNHSLFLDCRILLFTLVQLLRPRGISAPGRTIMPRFTGTPNKSTVR